MAFPARLRRELYDGLEEALGADRADTLMHLLPQQPADELVTISYFQTEMTAHRDGIRAEMADLRTEVKTDMSDLRTGLTREMADLRTEVKTEIGDVRVEIAELRTELKTEMADLGTEVKTEIGGVRVEIAKLRNELRGYIDRRFTALAATNVIAVVTALVT